MVVQNTDEKILISKLLISLSTENLICILQMFLWSYLSLKKAIGSPKAKEEEKNTEIVHFGFFWIGKGGIREQTAVHQKQLQDEDFYIIPKFLFYKNVG